MSFDIVTAIVAAAGFMGNAVIVLLAYRQGLRDGQKIQQGVPLPSTPVTLFPASRKQESSIEDVRMRTLINNINAYDGTERGQAEIK